MLKEGYALSLLRCNIYSEQIFKGAFYEREEEILMADEHMNNLRYADDMVIFADSMEGLSQLMNKNIRKKR